MGIKDIIAKRLKLEKQRADQEAVDLPALNYQGNGVARTNWGGTMQVDSVTNSGLGIGEMLPGYTATGSAYASIDSQPRVVRRQDDPPRRRQFLTPVLYRIDVWDGVPPGVATPFTWGRLLRSEVWLSGIGKSPTLVHSEPVWLWEGDYGKSVSGNGYAVTPTSAYASVPKGTRAQSTIDLAWGVRGEISGSYSCGELVPGEITVTSGTIVYGNSPDLDSGVIKVGDDFRRISDIGNFSLLNTWGYRLFNDPIRIEPVLPFSADFNTGIYLDAGIYRDPDSHSLSLSSHKIFRHLLRVTYATAAQGKANVGIEVIQPDDPLNTKIIEYEISQASSPVAETPVAYEVGFNVGIPGIATGTPYGFSGICEEDNAINFPSYNYDRGKSYGVASLLDIDSLLESIPAGSWSDSVGTYDLFANHPATEAITVTLEQYKREPNEAGDECIGTFEREFNATIKPLPPLPDFIPDYDAAQVYDVSILAFLPHYR